MPYGPLLQRIYSGRTYQFIRRALPPAPDLEADFSKGIVRDAPRIAIPPGAVYDSVDLLLHQPGMAQKRGGTSYAGPALTAATYAQAVSFAEFPGGSQIVAVGDNGHIYKVTSGTTTDMLGSTVSVVDKPELRIGGSKNLLIFPQSNGTGGPIKYDGSAAPAALGGTPPAGKFACVYKTRLVLANNNANPNRIFFSPTPDIEATWDTANAWIDADHAITGCASLRNALIIFGQSHHERIVGSTPPPGSDMDRAPVDDVGCTDARSIDVYQGNAIFANPRGVFMTNGVPGGPSLTNDGGISNLWQSYMTGYDSTTWTIAGGVIRSFYIVSIIDNTGALVACLMCNIPKRAWWRLTNISGMMFATGLTAQDELYYADRSTNRVVATSGMFMPAAGNKNDANGTAVTWSLETRVLGKGPGLKQYGFGHLSYDMRDAASDNPTLTVQRAPGIEATTYTATPESPLAKTTDETRTRVSFNSVTQGMSVKLSQTGPSAKTEIYALETDIRPLPLVWGGQ